MQVNASEVVDYQHNDPKMAIPIGYAEAELVCEKGFESAFLGLRNKLSPAEARIEQLSGAQESS